MTRPVVHKSEPVTLVGAGVFNADDLTLALKHAPSLVAADGGGNALVGHVQAPLAVIGDLDSLTNKARAAFSKVLHHVGEHTLSALNTMARHRDRPVILIGPDDISFLVPHSKITLDLPVATRLSLMPLADARVDTKGLRWEIRDAALHPAHAASISNETTAPQVDIHAMGPLLRIT